MQAKWKRNFLKDHDNYVRPHGAFRNVGDVVQISKNMSGTVSDFVVVVDVKPNFSVLQVVNAEEDLSLEQIHNSERVLLKEITRMTMREAQAVDF